MTIERVEKNGSELELKIIKTIAILELFRAGSGLDATQELVSSSLNDYGQEEIEEALRRLQHTKIIIYKKYRNAYNLYEGTDVNIDEKLKKLQQKNDELPLSSLTSEIAFQPVVAMSTTTRLGLFAGSDVCSPRKNLCWTLLLKRPLTTETELSLRA